MAEEFFDLRLCFRELILPNDQFPREPRRLERGEFIEHVEGHPGHSDQKDGGNAVLRCSHSLNRTEAIGSDKRKSLWGGAYCEGRHPCAP